jgi:predicted TIM-barrel fold metal-dependent hydrolase
MDAYPNLTVIIPHFGVTFFRPEGEFQTLPNLLDAYPNVYVDTSFGTRAILVQGLEAVSNAPETFRRFFLSHSGRIVFGTDMVVTGNSEKTPEWIEAVIRACRDVLEKDEYHFYMAAKGSPYALAGAENLDGGLRGMNLPNEVLEKVYSSNLEGILSRIKN